LVKNETYYKAYKKKSAELDKSQSEDWEKDFQDTLTPTTYTNTELSDKFRKEFNKTASLCYTVTKNGVTKHSNYKFYDKFISILNDKVSAVTTAFTTSPALDSMQLIVTKDS